jgi:hypothetical protein
VISLTPIDIEAIRKSASFRAWRVEPLPFGNAEFRVEERHYSVEELASAWALSAETVRSIFRDEPGVLKIGKPATKHKRGYITLRIPEEVAERVHQRLSA